LAGAALGASGLGTRKERKHQHKKSPLVSQRQQVVFPEPHKLSEPRPPPEVSARQTARADSAGSNLDSAFFSPNTLDNSLTQVKL
jgi:hypothetical protein